MKELESAMKIVHMAEVRHDHRLIGAYIAFRNAKVWPTRKAQRVLIATILVAVGFMFPPGPLRYALWFAAILIVTWVFVGDRAVAAVRLLRDPYHRSGMPERYEFGDRDFRRAAGHGADTCVYPYEHIAAVYADEEYWCLCLRAGEIAILDRTGVDGGATSPSAFDRFLSRKTGMEAARLDLSFSARARRAQEARRSYLDSKRGSALFARRDPREGEKG